MKHDERTYIPSCKRCGSLGAPCDIRAACALIDAHRQAHKTHKTYYTPIKTNTNTIQRGLHQ